MEELLSILIVDDDEVDRMAVQRSLRKVGVKLEVTEAQDCDSAITLLKKNTFDCVFLDFRLPDRDGLDLVKQVRSLNIKVPLIVLTGQGDEQIAVDLMKAGASDYLSKSWVSPERLWQVLRNAIRVHQAEMEAELANKRLWESNELLRRKNRELERQRKQIERQNRKLAEASRLKSQFLATMSHELRTPMNAIMGFSQLLLRQYPDPLVPQQLDMVQRIFNNAQHLLTMLNEVLDFSKIEAGHFQLEPTEFNLAQFVELTTQELRSLAVEKQLTLEVNINLEEPMIINDQNSIRQVLVNLISNAIKFTDSGGVWINVQEQANDQLIIAVKDTGVGIASDHLQEIFEAFRQINQTNTRKHYGTGLGLAIVDSLVKLMHGQVTVESQLGCGSIFQVEFPRYLKYN
ncbi:hybrid sensor histidine kinase/response regulator [Lyngbya sp. PCC 8106]|uniref:ATP-binding response regulator n=1 Tax=Lyngbya sp. (strain PCC 8106) TaxID=313612 RepID=UPI0000EAD151|nr:hybrid sensor histidine kinase/response regulator [Lyngbya sp. PCC 8106]EAW38245.1 Response Regulator Receiver Signal Transduction Histidine Kinase [Lyngbya sp. PCC 8106]